MGHGSRASFLPLLWAALFSLGFPGCGPGGVPADQALGEEELRARASELARELIIVDTHIDVPDRLRKKMEDISERTPGGDFDYPRAREGGLDAAFMSIYIPARFQNGGAKGLAEELINSVERLVDQWPDRFALARSPEDVRSHFGTERFAFSLGMENGAPIEGSLGNLEYFYHRGVRYITLAHSRANHICDSSYDAERKWNGLSPFGRKVVAEMNRLGIMIDVSHISDDSFSQVMDLAKAPVIASHSSCRAFTPGWERNMSDEMLLRLKENGGVIQINFGSSFVSDEYRRRSDQRDADVDRHLRSLGLTRQDEEAGQHIEKYRRDNALDYADITDVAANIDHVVELIGIDYVGLGSDFDGLGDSLPQGLKDVSDYPNLIYELLKRGYSKEDIRKICSGNLLRVWSEVEKTAQELRATG